MKHDGMMELLKHALYTMNDDLKDAEYYLDSAMAAKDAGMNECFSMYLKKAARRAGEDYKASHDILTNTMQKMATMGVETRPDSVEGYLWQASLSRYDHWAEDMKQKVKEMGL